MLRRAVVGVLTLGAVGCLALCVFSVMGRPRILFTVGYPKSYVLAPITQNKGKWYSIMLSEKYRNCNWDGQSLYIDGFCGICGDPWAPSDVTLVVAKLPGGLVYCTGRCPHLGRPKPIRMSALFGAAVVLSLYPMLYFFRGSPRQRRRRKGLCVVCGYDLRGSGERCPECGNPVGA